MRNVVSETVMGGVIRQELMYVCADGINADEITEVAKMRINEVAEKSDPYAVVMVHFPSYNPVLADVCKNLVEFGMDVIAACSSDVDECKVRNMGEIRYSFAATCQPEESETLNLASLEVDAEKFVGACVSALREQYANTMRKALPVIDNLVRCATPPPLNDFSPNSIKHKLARKLEAKQKLKQKDKVQLQVQVQVHEKNIFVADDNNEEAINELLKEFETKPKPSKMNHKQKQRHRIKMQREEAKRERILQLVERWKKVARIAVIALRFVVEMSCRGRMVRNREFVRLRMVTLVRKLTRRRHIGTLHVAYAHVLAMRTSLRAILSMPKAVRMSPKADRMSPPLVKATTTSPTLVKATTTSPTLIASSHTTEPTTAPSRTLIEPTTTPLAEECNASSQTHVFQPPQVDIYASSASSAFAAHCNRNAGSGCENPIANKAFTKLVVDFDLALSLRGISMNIVEYPMDCTCTRTEEAAAHMFGEFWKRVQNPWWLDVDGVAYVITKRRMMWWPAARCFVSVGDDASTLLSGTTALYDVLGCAYGMYRW